MQSQLTRARNAGYRIIYLDEICFTRSSVPKTEYCLKKQNMPADLVHINEPTLAIISAISKEKG